MNAGDIADRQRAAAKLAQDLASDLRNHLGVPQEFHALRLRFDGGTVTVSGAGDHRLAVVTGCAYSTRYFLVGEIHRRDGWAAFVSAGVRHVDSSTPKEDRYDWRVFFVEEPKANR